MCINDLASEVSSGPPTGVPESIFSEDSELDTAVLPDPSTMTSMVTGMDVSSCRKSETSTLAIEKRRVKKQARVKKLMKAMRKSEQVSVSLFRKSALLICNSQVRTDPPFSKSKRVFPLDNPLKACLLRETAINFKGKSKGNTLTCTACA